MQTKIIAIIALIIAVVGVAVFAGSKKEVQAPVQTGYPDANLPQSAQNTETSNSPSVPASTAASGETTYTMAQIALHKDASSCWTAIRGGVYDLTKWIASHPGGEDAIVSLCGRDGTADFDGQHQGQSRPEQKLISFKIGAVAR